MSTPRAGKTDRSRTPQLDATPSTVPYEVFLELSRRYESLDKQSRLLHRKYEDLESEHKSALARLRRAELKLVDNRKKVSEWQQWYESRPETSATRSSVRRKNQASGIPGPVADRPTSAAPSFRLGDEQTPAPDLSPAARDLPREALPSAAPLQEPNAALREPGEDLPQVMTSDSIDNAGNDNDRLSQHPSSQTTEGEPEAVRQERTRPDNDDAEPIIVSARTLRKGRQAQKIKREPSTNDDTHPVIPRVPQLRTQSSQASDLDRINGLVTTPRRRSKSGSEQVRIIEGTMDLQDTENRPPLEEKEQHSGDSRQTSSQSRVSAGPLTPLSINTRKLLRDTAHDTGTAIKRKHSPYRLEQVTEDGGSRKKPRTSTERSETLDDLLEGNQTPLLNPVLQPRMLATVRRQPKSHSPKEQTSNDRRYSNRLRDWDASTPKLASDKRVTTLTKEVTRPETPGVIEPDHEPLRSRPMKNLSLEDFKINPAYADSDFAYVDSIRKRDERRCIRGCTRPECCGELLKFAPNDGSGAATDETASDHDLLRDFLSEEGYISWLATRPTQVARRDMINKAKQQKFMDKYSRHRQMFEKEHSPPGYWRTEMPNTQELELDRTKARQREREKVNERYLDALRGNGRWLFRDE